MIYTVTLNPALDRIVEVEGLVPDDTNRIQKEFRYAGGKGIDVSRVLRELGDDSIALGFVGGYDGLELEGRLIQEGVRTDFTKISEETRTNIIIFDRCDRELEACGLTLNHRGGVRCFGTDALAPRGGEGYASQIATSGAIGSLYSRIVTEETTALVSAAAHISSQKACRPGGMSITTRPIEPIRSGSPACCSAKARMSASTRPASVPA